MGSGVHLAMSEADRVSEVRQKGDGRKLAILWCLPSGLTVLDRLEARLSLLKGRLTR